MRLSFDAIASQFDHQRGLPREALRSWVSLIDEIAAGSTLRVIEPGVGTGRIALPLAAIGHRITGTDISPQMLAECEMTANRFDIAERVKVVPADASDLPFGEHQFDLGVIAQLLYLVPDWPAVLDELARVVKPGGFVIHLTEPTTEGDALALWSSTWRQMIEATGYRHTSISPTDGDVHAEFLRRWPDVKVRPLASWTFGQSVAEAMDNYAARVRPLYTEIDEADFEHVVAEFLAWAESSFLHPETRLDGTVTFTAMVAAL